jgi:hypothetical protein
VIEQIAQALRQVFADERRAIASLDHARLAELAVRKHELIEQLARAERPKSPQLRALLATIRIEAYATAVLAVSANEAVRALLGLQTKNGYDRRAKPTCEGPASRIRITY